MDLEKVGPGGRKYCNKELPTAKSIINYNARPVRMPRDNHLSLLVLEILKVPPKLISMTDLPLFDPFTSPTVLENA